MKETYKCSICFRVTPINEICICTTIHKNPIQHPPHYGGDTIYEAIKVIEAWSLGFSLGNAVKYIARAGKKDKDCEVQDLKKALWYLSRHIQQLEETWEKKDLSRAALEIKGSL